LKRLLKSESLAIGLAMFSMFFGAGNIIFPLALGQYAGDKNFFAISGLILTAALIPIAGVIAMILFQGDYQKFFGRLGKVPGFCLALIIISLLGPLGSTPRCIALAYTTLKSSFLGLSPVIFSAIACSLILLFTLRKNHILNLLGYVLTPLLLLSLLVIMIMGLMAPSNIQSITETNTAVFLEGLKEGYNTMDLLAAFFFSSTILNLLKVKAVAAGVVSEQRVVQIAFKASFIGAAMLALVYIGFSYLAAFHGAHLGSLGKDELLSAIAMKIAGPYAGVLVCTTIALACLTTAIALICSFTDFMDKQVFKGKIRYELILAGSLFVTFMISILKFTSISAFLSPILQICYPGLIVLTFLNIAYHLKNFKPVKLPVFFAFTVAVVFNF